MKISCVNCRHERSDSSVRLSAWLLAVFFWSCLREESQLSSHGKKEKKISQYLRRLSDWLDHQPIANSGCDFPALSKERKAVRREKGNEREEKSQTAHRQPKQTALERWVHRVLR